MDVADLHSELQVKPAYFLDTLVAVASPAWPSILTVVTVIVVDLGAMVVFLENDHTKIAEDQKIQDHQDRLTTPSSNLGWLDGWLVGSNWFDFTGVSIGVP